MRSFQQQIDQFNARGIRIAAISTDPAEINRSHRQKLGLSYPILSASTEYLRQQDLLHEGAGPAGADIARPAELLLDAQGVVRWVNLTESATVRVRPERVLVAWDALSPKPGQ